MTSPATDRIIDKYVNDFEGSYYSMKFNNTVHKIPELVLLKMLEETRKATIAEMKEKYEKQKKESYFNLPEL